MTKFPIQTSPMSSEMFAWVVDTCGPSSNGKWRLHHLSYIEFEDEKHALLFALKWL
jgi:hypothetical protein